MLVLLFRSNFENYYQKGTVSAMLALKTQMKVGINYQGFIHHISAGK
jgi:hypothetical protein